MKFPRDAPKRKVIKASESHGFKIVRVGNHISMVRENPNGTKTPFFPSGNFVCPQTVSRNSARCFGKI